MGVESSEDRAQWDARLVTLSDASTVDLGRVAEGLGRCEYEERTRLAIDLVEHPNFSVVEAVRTVEKLNVMWWGDDPIECSAGAAALTAALAAHRQI